MDRRLLEALGAGGIGISGHDSRPVGLVIMPAKPYVAFTGSGPAVTEHWCRLVLIADLIYDALEFRDCSTGASAVPGCHRVDVMKRPVTRGERASRDRHGIRAGLVADADRGRFRFAGFVRVANSFSDVV